MHIFSDAASTWGDAHSLCQLVPVSKRGVMLLRETFSMSVVHIAYLGCLDAAAVFEVATYEQLRIAAAGQAFDMQAKPSTVRYSKAEHKTAQSSFDSLHRCILASGISKEVN